MGSKLIHPPGSRNESHTRLRLASRLITHPDGRGEHTVYPADATPETQLTRWVSALDGSFVDLDAVE